MISVYLSLIFGYSIIVIIFGIISVICAYNGKKYKKWLWLALVLHCLTIYGASSFEIDRLFYIQAIAPSCVLIIFWIWSVLAYKKAVDRLGISEEPNDEEIDENSSEDQIISFKCSECGCGSTGWYQKCPNCGAIGKMEKLDSPIINNSDTDDAQNQEEKIVEQGCTSSDEVQSNILDLNKADISPKIRRAFIFLEDELWEKADQYFDEVLDEDPENAFAYLGELMFDVKAPTFEALKIHKKEISNNKNFNRSMKYGNEALQSFLYSLLD